MIYKDLEEAERLGKTLIAVPIKSWKYCQKIRIDYPKLKQEIKELKRTLSNSGSKRRET